jgi:phosphomannomutase
MPFRLTISGMPSIQEIAPEIGFGTSGVRALVSQLEDRVVHAYTTAFLNYLRAAGKIGGSGAAILAHDLRPSSPGIAAACARAIGDAGLRLEYAGAIPTPALALRAMRADAPGIMVTGSHIPFDRNGIKFYTGDGEIDKRDEQGIRAAPLASLPEPGVSALPGVDEGARRAYLQRYLDFFPADLLSGLRLGLYQHSGVARDLLADLLAAFGAEVVPLARSDAFVPIDTEAVGEADRQRARQWCAELGLDALLSTDGDADRPLVCDARGEMLRGDVVGVLAAWSLGADAVATPVSSNSVVERCGLFKHVRRTRIGSPYVVEAMAGLQGPGATVVGYEANGGFLVGSPIRRDGSTLAPLPTRDAVLPMLALFDLARRRGLRLADLPGLLPSRHTASDRLQGIDTRLSLAFIGALADDTGQLADFMAPVGRVAGVDRTDGLRVTLDTGDIVHLRPSGNAPELRCYVEAASEAVAAELLAWGMGRARAALGAAEHG